MDTRVRHLFTQTLADNGCPPLTRATLSELQVNLGYLCNQACEHCHVEAGPKGAVIGFHNNTPPDAAKVMQWVDSKRGSIKIRPADQRLVAVRHWETPAERVKGVQSLMLELSCL